MDDSEGFNLRDLAAAARAFRTHGAFGKSMAEIARLSHEMAEDYAFQLLKIVVAFWSAFGLPDD